MIANSHTHYQTCFKVDGISAEVNVFVHLQNIIFGWLKKREKDIALSNNRPDFFRRCDWSNLWETRASVGTNTCLDGSIKTWAMRYTHPDSALGERRYWYTDVGLREENGTVTLYVRNSFARGMYDLAPEQDAPASTTPNFIHYIFRDRKLRVYSRLPKFPLRSEPGIIKVGMGFALAEALLDRARRYAIIVANGDDESLKEEAAVLAKNLAGKTQVFRMVDDQELAEEIKAYLPHNLLVPFGSLRIFYPLNPDNPRPERHRWFYITSPTYMEQREGILNGLLRNYSLLEDHAVTNISEVGRYVSLCKLRKMVVQGSVNASELKEFYTMYEELEKERDSYKAEADHWVSECDGKEQELRGLKSWLHSQPQYQSKRSGIDDFDCKKELAQLPVNLVDVVKIQAKIHADTLAFSEEALKSAADYTSFTEIEKAWELLNHLGTTLYRIKFGGEAVGDITQRFKDETGFEYAKTEGKQSKNDSSIRKTRELRFDGKDYEIWAHVKFGIEEPKMLRIHFDYDEEARRIVIGYVGSHMRNATTRSKK